jgi:hypothetical protein
MSFCVKQIISECKTLQARKGSSCPASSGNDLNVTEMVNNDSQMTKMAEQLNMNTKIKIYFDQHE